MEVFNVGTQTQMARLGIGSYVSMYPIPKILVTTLKSWFALDLLISEAPNVF